MKYIHTLELHAAAADAPSRVQAAARSAEAEATPRLVVRLAGDDLPDPLTAALIASLRRLREVGGAIAVVPTESGIAAALRVRGLERVLAFPLGEELPEPTVALETRRPRRRAAVRAAAATFAAAMIAASIPAGAQGELHDPEAIVARVVERNPSLSSYQSRLHVDVVMKSFPFLRQHLDGTSYYKKPANYEVVFDRVPSYAKGFEKLFSDVGDPTNWEKRFVVSYVGEAVENGHKDAQLRLVQRVRGMIDHEDVFVDVAAGTVDRIDYNYYNGGHITMTQNFRNVGGYTMLAAQNVAIAIPHIRAVASGTYDDYHTNVAIDDAVFKAGKSQ